MSWRRPSAGTGFGERTAGRPSMARARSTAPTPGRSRTPKSATTRGRRFSSSSRTGCLERTSETGDALVPSTLYLPDGRRVPVCVIEAPKEHLTDIEARDVRYPLNNIGGGSAIIANVQGRDYAATVACLVSDGHKVYALTNRHVAGEEGEIVYSRLDGEPSASASPRPSPDPRAVHRTVSGLARARTST